MMLNASRRAQMQQNRQKRLFLSEKPRNNRMVIVHSETQ